MSAPRGGLDPSKGAGRPESLRPATQQYDGHVPSPPLRATATWLVAGVASLALSWAALVPPESASTPPAPPPLPRPPSAAELVEIEALAAGLDAALARAAAELGRPLALAELEEVDPSTGTPWLGGPLPDNPLQPGQATVQLGCEVGASQGGEAPDWLYCTEQARLLPVIPAR